MRNRTAEFSFNHTTQEAEIKAFLNEFKIVSIDESIKDIAIQLRKKYSLKIPDLIIAATAIQLEIPLVTSDKDFKLVNELQIDFYSN